ncbi:MAG TPA: hypothetical protein DIW43_13345 [Spongiibacteraceae bacterium]|mgnify:FL=1|nr:hypothetical protein [Spongiibacteraceae bacterium]HCS28438.1 hypothetical protein [Spongiibacteraceae bacterium]
MTNDSIHAGIAVVTAVMLVLYIARFRRHPAEVFSPVAAWLRAFIYFGCCFLFAWLTGATASLLASPVIPAAAGTSRYFLPITAALTVFVLIAYWGIWAKWTLRFGRKLDIPAQLFFGLVWGVSYPLCFLGFWHLSLNITPDWPMWAVFLLAYTLISLWQYLWQDLYWDVYIAPEHDTPWTIKWKVPCTHIPNVTLCLIYFAVYDAYWIFIALQALALTGCSFAMRMPAPWSKEPTPPARRHPFVFGLVHGGGYVSEDPENDPHLRAIGAPY